MLASSKRNGRLSCLVGAFGLTKCPLVIISFHFGAKLVLLSTRTSWFLKSFYHQQVTKMFPQLNHFIPHQPWSFSSFLLRLWLSCTLLDGFRPNEHQSLDGLHTNMGHLLLSVGTFSLWGGGFLFRWGVMDYSGGYVVHLASGATRFTSAYWVSFYMFAFLVQAIGYFQLLINSACFISLVGRNKTKGRLGRFPSK